MDTHVKNIAMKLYLNFENIQSFFEVWVTACFLRPQRLLYIYLLILTVVVCLISILTLFFCSSSLFCRTLDNILKTLTIGISATFIFHSFFISQTWFRYLFIFYLWLFSIFLCVLADLKSAEVLTVPFVLWSPVL